MMLTPVVNGELVKRLCVLDNTPHSEKKIICGKKIFQLERVLHWLLGDWV